MTRRRPAAGLALACAMALGAATGAAAHPLDVFASVEGTDVVIEAKFSNGNQPVSGEVRIRDGAEALLATLPLGPDGTLRVPLASLDAGGGLLIEVETGGGHDDYRILTPAGLASPDLASPDLAPQVGN